MAAPIPITYQYNCRCERDTPIRTSPPYPLDPIDAVDVACAFTSVLLEVVIEYHTSRPYPIEVLEALDATASSVLRTELLTAPLDAIDAEADLLTLELRSVFQAYSNWPAEAVDTEADLASIELRQLLLSYADALPEAIDAAGDLLSVLLEPVLVANTMADEAIDVDADLLSIALVTP